MRRTSLPPLRVAIFISSLVVGSGGCFNPDEPPEDAGGDRAGEDGSGGEESDDQEAGDETEAFECIDFEQPCVDNETCCEYDPEFPVGSSQCVAVSAGSGATCASVCLTNDDCATDCCAALQGVSDYGACVDTSFCEGS